MSNMNGINWDNMIAQAKLVAQAEHRKSEKEEILARIEARREKIWSNYENGHISLREANNAMWEVNLERDAL